MSTEKQRERLKKVLALALDNPSRAEAEAALLKAQQMMLEDRPSPRPLEGDPIIDAAVTGALHNWVWQLGQVIGSNFRVFYSIDSHKGQSFFTGRKSDVERATEVFHSARRAAQYLAGQWWQANPDEPLEAQRDFLNGFAAGLASQFTRQVEGKSFHLMLLRDPEVEDYIRRIHYYEGRRTIIPVDNEESYQQGLQAGEEYNRPSGTVREGAER